MNGIEGLYLGASGEEAGDADEGFHFFIANCDEVAVNTPLARLIAIRDCGLMLLLHHPTLQVTGST